MWIRDLNFEEQQDKHAINESKDGDDIVTTDTKNNDGGIIGPPPTELYIYTLWKDFLSLQTWSDLHTLSEISLLPVIAGNKRLLISPGIIRYLLCTTFTNEILEKKRNVLKKESIRIVSVVEKERDKIKSLLHMMTIDDDKEKILDSMSKKRTEIFTSKMKSDESCAVSTDDASSGSVVSSVNAAITNVIDELTYIFSSEELMSALMVLQMPMLDGGIFETPPRSVLDTSTQRSDSNNRAGHIILNCLAYISSNNIKVYERVNFDMSRNTELKEGDFLLQYHVLTLSQRNVILLELLQAHRSRKFTVDEISKLKSLPLFTSREDMTVGIAVNDCKGGVYWCDSAAALEGLSQIGGQTSSAEANLNGLSEQKFGASGALFEWPVILASEPFLRELYEVVGIEELTPSTVARKFTLPSLNRMDGMERLRVMTGIANHWDKYKDDKELVESLKKIQFIPSWILLDNSGTVEELVDLSEQPRAANELFSWNNTELLDVLSGSQEGNYFPPPSLR
jgi:hypothetical protein